MRIRANRTGKKYGYLTFLEPVGEGGAGIGVKWRVRCDCGTEKVTDARDIVRGGTKTCGRGCAYHTKLVDAWKNNERYSKFPKEERFYRHMYKSYAKGAIEREKEWSLSFEEFNKIVNQSCVYCSSEPTTRQVNNTKGIANGIDRVNNSIGYTPENCVTCCGVCNKMKSTLGIEVFIDRCLRIAATHLSTK